MGYRNFITSPSFGEGQGNHNRRLDFYKQGVKARHPKQGQPLRFQILPAFGMEPGDTNSFAQCLQNGEPTPWFGMIRVAKFVGHGADWRTRANILSLSSFDDKEPCPYERILKYCCENPDWSYLVKGGYTDIVIKKVSDQIIMNIVNVDNPGDGVIIGEFSRGIAESLLRPGTGIVFQPNLMIGSLPNANELLAQNPMLAYANGDITNPDKAPVFVVEYIGAKTGKFGNGYAIRVDTGAGGAVTRRASDVELSSRYHLEDPDSFLDIPSGQDIVDAVCDVLRGYKNSKGIDETCMVKEAVGDTYRVDVESAPGAVNTMGWTGDRQEIQAQRSPSSPVAPAPSVAQPVQARTPQAQSRAQSAPKPGFAPSPALAADIESGVTVQHQPIPGEPTEDESALAARLAARMRNQMKMRQ